MAKLNTRPSGCVEAGDSQVFLYEGGSGRREMFLVEDDHVEPRERFVAALIGEGLDLSTAIEFALDRLPKPGDIPPDDYYAWTITHRDRVVARVWLGYDGEARVERIERKHRKGGDRGWRGQSDAGCN